MSAPIRLRTHGRKPLSVVICQLCAALVFAPGERAHERVHAVTLRPDEPIDLDEIRGDDALITDLADGAPAQPGDLLGELIQAWIAEIDREDDD